MAADDDKKQQTSEQHMRTLQFNDKLSQLNREFIRQLQEWYKQCPHYDFSTSVKSYLEHIKQLDDMYALKPAVKSTVSETPTTSASGRVFAKAKRRVSEANNKELNDSAVATTPSGAPPPKLSTDGDVSVNKPDADVSQSGLKPKLNNGAETGGNGSGGRKRAIRGGGPLGGAETVIFRGTDKSAISPTSTTPLATITLPKPTPGFWSKQKRDTDPKDTSKPTFTFGSAKENKESTSGKQDDNLLKVPPSTFGGGKPLSFGTNSKEPSPFSFFASGKKGDSKSEKTEDSPASSLKTNGDISKSGSSLSSDSPASKKDDNIGDNKKPSVTFPSFGTSTTSSIPTGGLKFSFGDLPKSSTEAAEKEEEYIPPKAEWVDTEEPDSVFSSKCSVFKMVDKQYKKLGVGKLHLKVTDGKKSVLVRAGTAIGTVWINALMNKTLKAVKADEKGEKIRLLCPMSEKEMATFLIRFPSAKEASKVLEEIEAASK